MGAISSTGLSSREGKVADAGALDSRQTAAERRSLLLFLRSSAVEWGSSRRLPAPRRWPGGDLARAHTQELAAAIWARGSGAYNDGEWRLEVHIL